MVRGVVVLAAVDTGVVGWGRFAHAGFLFETSPMTGAVLRFWGRPRFGGLFVAGVLAAGVEGIAIEDACGLEKGGMR